jgi:beta-RFAP synthase
MKTRIVTGSRLHFGLLSLPPTEPWPRFIPGTNVPARYFGGIGMMVEEPRVEVVATPASTWEFSGLHVNRIREFASRLIEHYRLLPTKRIEVISAPPQHQGFGVGTQLAMAVGSLLHQGEQLNKLAHILGRGQRSNIGMWVFSSGGLIVDPGKSDPTQYVEPVIRRSMPEWSVILATLPITSTWSADREKNAFATLANSAPADDMLYRIILTGIIPGIDCCDVKLFGDALTEYNRRAGQLFSAVQGGCYAHSEIEELVGLLLRHGFTGVGQSSWGPTVFAFTDDLDRAAFVQKVLQPNWPTGTQVIITKAKNN